MNRVDYESIVIQDVFNLAQQDELNLSPWYQRRSVWTTSQKSYLINSLFEGKPVPSIYVRHYLDLEREKSIKEVVDGQQRLRAVIGYVLGEFAARHPQHAGRIKYTDLTAQERTSFRMTKLSVGYLIDADDADVIEIFGRLNSVSKTLNAQERRNAAFSGEMKQFCLKQAAARVQLWRDLRVFSATSIARMDEVQFVSDLVFNLLNGLSDFSPARLNALYKENDESFTKEKKTSERLERVFAQVASIDPTAIRDTIFSRTPLFFSLFLVLDEATKKPTRKTIESALFAVDQIFNDGIPLADRPDADAKFLAACTASTQRISSRRVRHAYLKKAFGLH